MLIVNAVPPLIVTSPPVWIKGPFSVIALAVVEERVKVPEEPCVIVPAAAVVIAAPALIIVVPVPAVENELLKFKAPAVKATFPSVMVVIPLKFETLPDEEPEV